MSWSNELVTNKSVQKFCNKFSLIVKQSVIDSPWVPGFLEVIESNYNRQKHILMTGTPKDEIEDILEKLDIRHFFYKVCGAPIIKNEVISIELNNLRIFIIYFRKCNRYRTIFYEHILCFMF